MAPYVSTELWEQPRVAVSQWETPSCRTPPSVRHPPVHSLPGGLYPTLSSGSRAAGSALCAATKREMEMGCFPKAGGKLSGHSPPPELDQLQADDHRRVQWVSVMEREPCDGHLGQPCGSSQNLREAVVGDKAALVVSLLFPALSSFLTWGENALGCDTMTPAIMF